MPFIKYVTGFLAGVFACLTVLALLPEASPATAVLTTCFAVMFSLLTYTLVVAVAVAGDLATVAVNKVAGKV